MTNLRHHIMTFQNFELEIRHILATRSYMVEKTPSNAKYTEALVADLDKAQKSTSRFVNVLKRAVAEKPVNISSMRDAATSLKSHHAEMVEWASKFGLVEKAPSTKRRKNAAVAE